MYNTKRLRMAKKHIIKPKTAIIISSLFIAISMVCIVMLMNHLMMEKINNRLELQLKQTYKEILRGYSETVTTRLQNYFYTLDGIDAEIFLDDNASDQAKLEHLQKLNIHKHRDFYQIYYCDNKGNAWQLDGTSINISDRSYFKEIIMNDEYNYVSDAINSRNTNKPIVILSRALYGEDGKIQGVLLASIMLTRLQQIFSQMDVGAKDDFALFDSRGILLAHSDPSLLFKIYTPEDDKYSFYNTNTIAKLKEGVVKTKDCHGNPIFNLFEPVKNSSWVVAIKIPESVFTSMSETQKLYEHIGVLVSSLVIILLLLVEVKIMDFFQKKQLITSTYDNLTGLWTRQMFETEATKLIKRHPKNKFMLIECDIRGFKFINQNYGEKIADDLVIYYTSLLQQATEEAGGIIGRAFADHVYILVEITTVRKAMNVFKAKMQALNDVIKKYEVPFTPKVGIAFILSQKEAKETTIQALIGNASFAKSTIKDNALDQFAIYNSHLLKKVINERYVESHMESALENEEFFVMYQPKILLETDGIVGAEALVRWNSEKLGIVTPDNFIPLFERNGFITKLDFFVYKKVFDFIQGRLDRGEDIVTISVNMSRNHNKPDKFYHDFMELFNKYTIPPHLVQIEILERSIMDRNTLQEITMLLHKEGFTVAMDDFGSGESSLNMLTKIPVDVLKFDKTFLTPSEESTEKSGLDLKTENFIQSLIKLGKNLDKETIFEGVETEEQRDFLRSIGCDQVQGYFYSKPLMEQDFVEYIENHFKKN